MRVNISKDEIKSIVQRTFKETRNSEQYIGVILLLREGLKPADVGREMALVRNIISGIIHRIRVNPELAELIPEADQKKQKKLGRIFSEPEKKKETQEIMGLWTVSKLTKRWERGECALTRKRPRAGIDIFNPEIDSSIPVGEQHDSWRENL